MNPPHQQTYAFGLDSTMVCVLIFVVFFCALVFHLRREDKREGYLADTVTPTGRNRFAKYLLPMPWEKTFRRPHDRPPVTNPKRGPLREAEVRPARAARGLPIRPKADGLLEGIGPAAWQNREDDPDLDLHGRPKIIPLSKHEEYFVAAGDPDPRGWEVIGSDGERAGEIVDLWFNRAEFFLRYLEMRLDAPGAGTRILPLFFTAIDRKRRRIRVPHMPAARFKDAPTLEKGDEITMREEDRVNAFFAGGRFYGSTPLGPA